MRPWCGNGVRPPSSPLPDSPVPAPPGGDRACCVFARIAQRCPGYRGAARRVPGPKGMVTNTAAARAGRRRPRDVVAAVAVGAPTGTDGRESPLLYASAEAGESSLARRRGGEVQQQGVARRPVREEVRGGEKSSPRGPGRSRPFVTLPLIPGQNTLRPHPIQAARGGGRGGVRPWSSGRSRGPRAGHPSARQGRPHGEGSVLDRDLVLVPVAVADHDDPVLVLVEHPEQTHAVDPLHVRDREEFVDPCDPGQ